MVCIYLPRLPGSVDRTDISDRIDVRESANAIGGETVLVVDDEPVVRMLVTEVLKELGYVAFEAADGIGGLAVLQSDVRIDLLVADVGLPGGMNGRQMAEPARARRPDLKVPFITSFAEHTPLNSDQLEPGTSLPTKRFAIKNLAARMRALIEAKP